MKGLFTLVTACLAGLTIATPLPDPDIESRQTTNYVGYLISTFSDATPQIQWHLSSGADLNNFRFLNSGRPILASNVGTRGVRDIYLTTNTARSEYYLIATGTISSLIARNWNCGVLRFGRS